MKRILKSLKLSSLDKSLTWKIKLTWWAKKLKNKTILKKLSGLLSLKLSQTQKLKQKKNYQKWKAKF